MKDHIHTAVQPWGWWDINGSKACVKRSAVGLQTHTAWVPSGPAWCPVQVPHPLCRTVKHRDSAHASLCGWRGPSRVRAQPDTWLAQVRAAVIELEAVTTGVIIIIPKLHPPRRTSASNRLRGVLTQITQFTHLPNRGAHQAPSTVSDTYTYVSLPFPSEVQFTKVPAAFMMMSASEAKDGAEPGKGSMGKWRDLLAGGTPKWLYCRWWVLAPAREGSWTFAFHVFTEPGVPPAEGSWC